MVYICRPTYYRYAVYRDKEDTVLTLPACKGCLANYCTIVYFIYCNYQTDRPTTNCIDTKIAISRPIKLQLSIIVLVYTY